MKIFYVISGCIALILGVVGIFLPVLPTTPFLLITAALWYKGSPRLHDWLLGTKHLGTYIRNFRETRTIPLRAKVVSVSMLWVTIPLSASRSARMVAAGTAHGRRRRRDMAHFVFQNDDTKR